MAPLRVDIQAKFVAEIERVADAFLQFGERALPRAVQFKLNRIAVDGVNRFWVAIPTFWDNLVDWLGEGVWYEPAAPSTASSASTRSGRACSSRTSSRPSGSTRAATA